MVPEMAPWLAETLQNAQLLAAATPFRAALAASLVLLTSWLILSLGGVEILGMKQYEELRYELKSRIGALELRGYPAHVLARFQQPGDYDDVAERGFQSLFRYITGANDKESRMAMTVPVCYQHEPSGGALSFVMPAAAAREGLPAPRDPKVELTQVSPRLVAAVRFRGVAYRWLFEEQSRRLMEALPRCGLEAAGPPVLAQYNAPFVPGLLRRNEVMIEVRPIEGVTREER